MPLYAVREQNLRSDSVAEIETEEQAEDETEYEKTVVKKAVSSLLYENAMGNGIDVRYTVAPYSVKEDIILREKTVFHSYTMHVDANGLTAVKTEDNRVEFRDAEEQMVFTLKTPYMYDAADAISGDIEIAVVQEGEDCTITYTPDSAWLNDEARVYPVTIDPESTSRYHAVSDTYVHEGDSSCCSGITPSTYGRLYIGKKGGRVHRAYLKIETLPSVLAGSYIEASTLYAQCYAGTSTSKPFSLNKVTSSWNASTLGWNPQPASSDIQANVERNTSTNVIAFTNCRDTVARMYNGNMANNGFMIHYTNETQNDYNSIYSYENSNTSGHPYLWVQYRAPANIANGTYYIRNKNSGLYLDVPNWGGSQTNLKQYDFNGGTNQRWVIQRQSNGLYVLKPSHNTNLAIDVYNALDQDNVNIWAFTANNSAAQEWYIIPNEDGSSRILSRCSNGWRALVVQSASSSVGANIIQHTYTAGGNTNDDWYLETQRPTIRHSGDILIGLSSDAYGTSKNNTRCGYGYRGSATESANYFAQYITGSMYSGYNDRRVLFNRQNEQASKNDFLSKSLHSISGDNIDDVDLMFFSGHGTATNGFHFSYGPNNTIHANNPTIHDNPNLNAPQSQIKLGYGGSRTKWLVGYTCNLLTSGQAATFPMMEGGHIIMGYASTAYLIRNQMGELGLRFKLAEKNMIDAYFDTASIHTQYASFDATLAAICIPQARYDTIYDYVDSSATYRSTQILYITRVAPGQ